jgi:hypothetical protein
MDSIHSYASPQHDYCLPFVASGSQPVALVTNVFFLLSIDFLSHCNISYYYQILCVHVYKIIKYNNNLWINIAVPSGALEVPQLLKRLN